MSSEHCSAVLIRGSLNKGFPKGGGRGALFGGNSQITPTIKIEGFPYFTAIYLYKQTSYNCARLRRPYGKMGGLGGSVWVMGEWPVSQWILN